IEKAVVVIWRKQHHQFRGESRNTLAGAGNHAIDLIEYLLRRVDISHQRRVGKTVKISVHIRLPFRQKRRHQGGSASSPTPVYSGSCPGFAEWRWRQHSDPSASPPAKHCVARTSYAGDLAYPPRVVRRRGYPVRYEFALPAPPE